MTRRIGALRLAPMWAASALSLGAVGCLDDAPEYPERALIPPFILSAQVKPTTAEVYDDGVPMRINVPFRSEDVNQDLNARFYLNLLPGDADGDYEGGTTVIEASTYDDTSRYVSFQWENPRQLPPGCYSLTMVLTYVNNLDGRQMPSDWSRATSLVWWIDLEDTQGTVLIRTCPRAN